MYLKWKVSWTFTDYIGEDSSILGTWKCLVINWKILCDGEVISSPPFFFFKVVKMFIRMGFSWATKNRTEKQPAKMAEAFAICKV